MKKLIFIVAPLLLIFVGLGVSDIHRQRQLNQEIDIQLNTKEIKVKTLEQKTHQLLQNLENQEDLTEEQKQENKKLQEEIKQLEKELQAKLQREEQERIAQKKLQQASNTATATATAYASDGSCAEWIAQAGITEVAMANELIQRESGCNPNAVNPSSGACGVAQELPCNKSGCGLGNGACQVKWMQSYVKARYGSWSAAIAFHNANNWY